MPAYDAAMLCSRRAPADYFEDARLSGSQVRVNWIMTEVLECEGRRVVELSVSAANPAGLLRLILTGEISGKMGKAVFAGMVGTGKTAEQVVSEWPQAGD
jgi:aspartyl-tRNA(Asn)/glutamyl-tRNA(Gln) amidotransferase subunit B